MGVFKGKEKKTLQEQIDQLSSRIKSIEKRVDDEETEVKQKADKEYHSYDAQIQPLEQRIKEIDEELTKPR